MFSSPTQMGKKPNSTISKNSYLEAAQLFHWAVKEHYIMWFTGKRDRHKRTETMLPRLVKNGKLIRDSYQRRFVYTVPRRKNDNNIEHGLGCTEGLVRIWRSRMDGTIINERYLRGFHMVPEWGILYPNNKLLLFEFNTKDNFLRLSEMKSKLTRYRKNLHFLEAKFFGSDAVVLFVAAVTRAQVKKFVQYHMQADGPFWFTDYQSFLKVPLGEQLNAPIYVWGQDGKEYSLAK